MVTHRRPALLACLLLAVAPACLAQLPDTPIGTWRVEAIGGSALPAAPRTDITFAAEGRVHGTGGCNRFMGGYTLDGATLRFGPIAGTRMACEAPAMEQETRFHDALATVRGWRRDGPSLLLTDGVGATVLRLVRAEAG